MAWSFWGPTLTQEVSRSPPKGILWEQKTLLTPRMIITRKLSGGNYKVSGADCQALVAETNIYFSLSHRIILEGAQAWFSRSQWNLHLSQKSPCQEAKIRTHHDFCWFQVRTLHASQVPQLFTLWTVTPQWQHHKGWRGCNKSNNRCQRYVFEHVTFMTV